MLWMTKCDCNSSKFHTGGCDICPQRIIFWKTDCFVIVNNNNKIAFDVNINVTLGMLVFLFLAKSLGVYKYTTPSKGTGTCYLRECEPGSDPHTHLTHVFSRDIWVPH